LENGFLLKAPVHVNFLQPACFHMRRDQTALLINFARLSDKAAECQSIKGSSVAAQATHISR